MDKKSKNSKKLYNRLEQKMQYSQPEMLAPDGNLANASEEFLDNNNIIKILGEITDETASDIISKLIYLGNNSSEPIFLLINTTGGSVNAAFAIISVMKSLPNYIIAIGLGNVFSAGTYIFAHANERYSFIGTEFLYHEAYYSGVYNTSITINDASEMHEDLIKIKNHDYVKFTKNLFFNGEDRELKFSEKCSLSAKEALDNGFVEKIVNSIEDIVPDKIKDERKKKFILNITDDIIDIFYTNNIYDDKMVASIIASVIDVLASCSEDSKALITDIISKFVTIEHLESDKKDCIATEDESMPIVDETNTLCNENDNIQPHK